MLKEALQFLTNQAEMAKSVYLLEIPGVSTHRLLVENGKSSIHPLPPPLRSLTVDNCDDLIAGMKEYGDDRASLWVSEGKVVGVLNDAERREWITMPITLHDHYRALLQLRTGMRLSQENLIKFMRVTLHGVIAEDVIAKFRRIDFARHERTKAERLKDRESLGKSVETEVQGIDEIPDGIMVTIRLFANRDLPVRKNIRLILDAKPSDALWEVTAVGEDLDNGLADSLAELVERLRDDLEVESESARKQSIQVFSGEPV